MKKILVADDSLTIQKIVELTLEGLEVTAVGHGDEAREQVETLVPDLVIADVNIGIWGRLTPFNAEGVMEHIDAGGIDVELEGSTWWNMVNNVTNEVSRSTVNWLC